MTFKHQGKNISAENDVTQLFDIDVRESNGEITAVRLTRKDFYNDVDKTTYDLMDYFYTEQEIDNFVRIHLVVYDSFSELPQTNNGISSGKSNYIYLVPFVDSEGVKEGVYKEYVWVKIKNSSDYRTNESDHNDYVLDGDHYNYEVVGSTEIDLSQIRQDILNLQQNKLDKAKVKDNLTTSTYSSSDPTALSAKQGKVLNDTKVNKDDIVTNLTTNDDTKVLSAKQGKLLQDNKVNKTDIATDLTTNDDTKVLSAKQGKLLQDNKVNKTDIATNLTTNDDTKVLSAKQGKLLQDNKVDKTSIIDNLANDNTNPITSNAVYDSISEIFDELKQESICLSSSSSIVQKDAQLTLVAKLYSNSFDNRSVSLYEVDNNTETLINTVNMFNGAASFNYTGTGYGEKKFKVKSGDLVSNPYEVIDAIFKDRGTSTDYGTWTSTDFTGTKINRGDDYTTLTPSDTWDRQDLTVTDENFCIELDINVTYSSTLIILRCYNSTTLQAGFNQTNLNLTSGEWKHIKLVREGTTVTPFVDGVEKDAQTFTGGINKFSIIADNSKLTDIKYKNFCIYPI